MIFRSHDFLIIIVNDWRLYTSPLAETFILVTADSLAPLKTRQANTLVFSVQLQEFHSAVCLQGQIFKMK